VSARRVFSLVGLICLGYIVAVTAATIVTVFFHLLPTVLPDAGRYGSFFAFVSGMLSIGFFWTFIFAWPGFIVAITLIERSAMHRPLIYSIAGILNVIPSLALFSGFVGSPFAAVGFVLAALPGGLAGGLAYWLFPGRIRARASATA